MRWRQPAPPEPWEGVRANPRVLTRCPQPARGPAVTFDGYELADDEDCLKLAIWAPLTAIHAAEEAEERAQIAAIEAAEAAEQAEQDAAERAERAAIDGSRLPRDERPMGSSGGLPGGSSDSPDPFAQGQLADDGDDGPPDHSAASRQAARKAAERRRASGGLPGGANDRAEAAEPDTSHLLPIIVYIHGGGGRFGSCHAPHHGGEALARTQNVVFISMNYRLGVLGFLAHPALSAEDRGHMACAGNYAIADQVAALTWIQHHAASFGGNKRNITLMGLSSGAQFVSTLLVSPPIRHPQWGMGADSRPTGLFQRAFVQSCVDLPNVRKLQSSCDIWLKKSAEEWGEELAEAMGCPTEEDAELADSWHIGQLASLRKLPVETILEHSWDEAATDCYESTIDMRGAQWGGALACLKPISSLEALETGGFHRVPLMIGATEQDGLGKSELEMTMFEASDATDMAGLKRVMEQAFGEQSEEALARYLPPGLEEEAAVEGALGQLGRAAGLPLLLHREGLRRVGPRAGVVPRLGPDLLARHALGC